MFDRVKDYQYGTENKLRTSNLFQRFHSQFVL